MNTRMITTTTSLFATLSSPASTVGSILYNSLFESYGVDALFIPTSSSNADRSLEGLRSLGFSGVTVSMPYKKSIVDSLDGVDARAAEIGAVNTISINDGMTRGYNSDWYGAVCAIQENTDLSDKSVLVIGAGGAARAIVYGMREARANVTVSNRTNPKATGLATDLNVNFCTFPELEESLQGFDIVVNATSVGFNGRNFNEFFERLRFRENQVVLDIVFTPIETPFLLAAIKQGTRTIPGYKMLLHQALYQCEIWFGYKLDNFQKAEEALVQYLCAHVN